MTKGDRFTRTVVCSLRNSESHRINSEEQCFVQIQLYGFNAELYHNMSEAQHKSQGIVGISLMVQVSKNYQVLLVNCLKAP